MQHTFDIPLTFAAPPSKALYPGIPVSENVHAMTHISAHTVGPATVFAGGKQDTLDAVAE